LLVCGYFRGLPGPQKVGKTRKERNEEPSFPEPNLRPQLNSVGAGSRLKLEDRRKRKSPGDPARRDRLPPRLKTGFGGVAIVSELSSGTSNERGRVPEGAAIGRETRKGGCREESMLGSTMIPETPSRCIYSLVGLE